MRERGREEERELSHHYHLVGINKFSHPFYLYLYLYLYVYPNIYLYLYLYLYLCVYLNIYQSISHLTQHHDYFRRVNIIAFLATI